MSCSPKVAEQHAGQVLDRAKPSSHTNFGFLWTPEKMNLLHNLHKANRQLKQQLERMNQQIRHLIEWDGMSSGAYEALRLSGYVKLPSQRTLQDYTHHVPTWPGLSKEVDQQSIEVAKLQTCAEFQKYVALVEMHIKEDLVYDKHSGELVGFINLGETNNVQKLSSSPKAAAAMHQWNWTSSSDVILLMRRSLPPGKESPPILLLLKCALTTSAMD